MFAIDAITFLGSIQRIHDDQIVHPYANDFPVTLAIEQDQKNTFGAHYAKFQIEVGLQ